MLSFNIRAMLGKSTLVILIRNLVNLLETGQLIDTLTLLQQTHGRSWRT